MSTKHHVYAIMKEGVIVYVGRSLVPKERWRSAQRRYNDSSLTYKILRSYLRFSFAQRLERELIKNLRPKFNKSANSSPGRMGYPSSAHQIESVVKAWKGRHLTPEHKRKLWETRTFTEKDRNYYRKLNEQQFSDEEKRAAHKAGCDAWRAARRKIGLSVGRTKGSKNKCRS